MDVSVTIKRNTAGAQYDYRGGVIPYGLLLANGALLNVSEFPRLFEVIGYTYGGSGSQFKLPDSRGRVDVSSSGTRPLAQAGGAETHQVTESELPQHTHSVPDHGHRLWGSSGYDSWKVLGLANPFAGDAVLGSERTLGEQYVKTSSLDPKDFVESSTITLQSVGSGESHNNMQPFLVANKLIQY